MNCRVIYFAGVRGFTSRGFREIQMREFSVVFWGGPVIGLGGGNFFGEVAEVVTFVVGCYLGGPFPASLVPVDAFVL